MQSEWKQFLKLWMRSTGEKVYRFIAILQISQLANSGHLEQLNLPAALESSSSPTAEGLRYLAQSPKEQMSKDWLQELTLRHLHPRWIWPSASVNHFEQKTNSLNSLGHAGQSSACIPERKSRSFTLHLQRWAGLATLICKLKVAQESSPLPLSTQGTWDTNRQIFSLVWVFPCMICNGDFSSELRANVLSSYKSSILVQIWAKKS